MKIVLYILFLVCCITSSSLAQTDVHKIDFKNFTYRLSCGDADTASSVTVRNGEYSGVKNSIPGGNDTVYLKITEVLFGDINGDGKDEAIVLYMCGSGASYAYFQGLIFSVKNNRPRLLTEITGGNKGDGGFEKVYINKGLLIVRRYQLPPASSACCPAFIETTKYKLKGKSLVRIGKTRVEKIPPTTGLSKPFVFFDAAVTDGGDTNFIDI